MKTISLNGPWRMRKAGAARFYDVTVPTTVCTDLLANGLLEDPYYRDNEDARSEEHTSELQSPS